MCREFAKCEPKLDEVMDKYKKWDIEDKCAKSLHHLIAEVIALENIPFSVVSSVGFTRRYLSNKTFLSHLIIST